MVARTVDKPEAGRVLELSKKLGALQFGDYTLTSGEKSTYYFDGRLINLDPEGAYLVGQALLPAIRASNAEAVAGPAVAAIPMVSAIGFVSLQEGAAIPGLIVRDEARSHGTGKRIEGSFRPGMRIAVIDDACSTGGSLIMAVEAVEEAGGKVVAVGCILDRHMGGSDEIRRRGYDFTALLEADEQGNISPVGGGQ